MALALDSVEAQALTRGWVAQAARAFELQMLVVDISVQTTARVVAAQQWQVQANLTADEAVALGGVDCEADEEACDGVCGPRCETRLTPRRLLDVKPRSF